MNMLIEELQNLGDDPRSWIVVAVMALLAAVSVWRYFNSPLASGAMVPTDAEVAHAREIRTSIGARFGLLMLGGAAVTVVGLVMIAQGVRPTLALGMIAAGIVVTQTEPYRLLIREQSRIVTASRDAPADELESARDRLRANQRSLALINLVLLGGVVGVLISF